MPRDERISRLVVALTLLLVGQCVTLVSSSIHSVQGKCSSARFTERMFADGRGPLGMRGASTVTVNATISPLLDHEVTDTISLHRLTEYFDFGVVVVSYTEGYRFSDNEDRTICTTNFSDPVTGNMEGVVHGEFHAIEDGDQVLVASEFHPVYDGLQVVVLLPCWKQKSESFGYPVSADEFTVYPMKDPIVCVNATITFKNPYGYLPALLYGLYPFTVVLSVMYAVVGFWFITLICRHRHQVLGVQYMVLTVLLLTAAEAVSWAITYDMLNNSGQRVCCPYPGMIMFSTLLKILAGMVARIATTLVCLGYGIVRPTISGPEVLVVSGLGVCYFISVGALEISHLLNQSDGKVSPPAVWGGLVMATNLCFAVWIFTSLALTRKNLAAFGQTMKLDMYSKFGLILYAYVILSFFLMGTEGIIYSGAVYMDWQYMWIFWAASRLFLFGILLVVAVIWHPQATSRHYAHMDQIPSQELMTPSSGSLNTEQIRRVPCAMDEPTPRSTVSTAMEEDDESEADASDLQSEHVESRSAPPK